MNTTDEEQPPPAAQLLRMISGKATTQLLYVAAKLGVADHLEHGARSADQLARETGTEASALYRVLRALAGMGIFAETESGEFELTPLAEPLRSDAPDSVRDFAIMFGSPWHNQAWSHLLESVRTGEPAFNRAFGEGLFDHLHTHPERFTVFNDAMTALSRLDVDAVFQAYDFSRFDSVVDVGGGHGYLLAEILNAHPQMNGRLLEIPEVAREARGALENAGVADRAEVIEGDFFERVPDGGDAYVLKLIIHDWDDEQARTILENCRDAMPADGTLLVMNSVLPPGNESYMGKMVDIEMLVMSPGGKERTEEEFERLFREAGFELNRTISTPSYLYVLEGTPT